ncbi:MAG: hypothetical protein MRY59_03890 [Aquisalinus sp.]|nr:hypothetical protein [Aquisalinus sp.]
MKNLANLIILFSGVTILLFVPAQAQQCIDVKILNRNEVMASNIELYTIGSDQSLQEVESIPKAEIPLPLSLQACEGLSQWYVWQNSSGNYLVDKADFSCVVIQTPGLKRGSVIGSPGLGEINECAG